MAQAMSSEELALVSALKPFATPHGQALIDVFLNLVEKPSIASEHGNLDVSAMRAEVTQLVSRQVENLFVLLVIFALLFLPLGSAG
ncbi:MAG TPA: hypothetical protein GXX51_04055 [Firmicutes bacterium]|nr:hypothetical protein [Bacillota bacterium]